MRSPFKLSALFLTAAIAMGVTGQANAMEARQKGTFADIENVLAQENQIVIATAKYVLNPKNPQHMQILRVKFTNNARGESYILMANGADDAHATTEFVYARLKNIHVYDPHNVGVMPQGVAANSSLAELIKSVASTSDGLMIHGQVAQKQADGTDQTTGSMTILANLTRDETVSDRVIIFNTTLANQTQLADITAFDVRYNGSANLKAANNPQDAIGPKHQ